MKKSDCTPEQWEAYRAYQRDYYQKNREKVTARKREKYPEIQEQERARLRAYHARPEVKERQRIYDAAPEKVAARKAYHDEYGQARKKRIWQETKSDAEKLEANYAKLRQWRTGMTAGQFDALLVLQGNACAICSRPFSGRKGDRSTKQKAYPCADHCHDGGGPRGLLCLACNHIEGNIRLTGLSILEFCDRLHDYLLNPPINIIKDG